MIPDWDGDKPDFRVGERVGYGHNSHYPLKKNPWSHMSIYKIKISYLYTASYEIGFTDNQKKGCKSSSTARLYIIPNEGATIPCTEVLVKFCSQYINELELDEGCFTVNEKKHGRPSGGVVQELEQKAAAHVGITDAQIM